MRRTTALIPIIALLLVGAATTPAEARPVGKPAVHRPDARSRARLVEVRADRDAAVRDLERRVAAERRRAERKFAGLPLERKAAHRRLDQWYESHRAAIERRFADRRQAILAESAPAGPARALARLRARRDADLRRIDADLVAEHLRAQRKFAGRRRELKAAYGRLAIWAERRREKVRAEFLRERAKLRVRVGAA